ncbi:MAG: hypothetical protein IKU25_08860 [Clostridia bacterium]|nr:hypothetical protein [Clostridia bacterium]
MAVVILVGCFVACTPEPDDDNGVTRNYFTTTAPSTTTEVTQVYYATGMTGFNYLSTIEYTGQEIERPYVISSYIKNPVSIVLFTNGYLQPYSVDGSEYAYSHTLAAGQQYTIRFHPVTGKAGESVTFIAYAFEKPEFKKSEDGTYYDFLDWHRTCAGSGVTIEMKVDSPDVTPDVADEITYTKELETIFRSISLLGDNPVSTMTQTDFRVYDKVVKIEKWQDLKEEHVAMQNAITAQRGTEHEIFISGYGKAGRYRVCLFINDELQYAFDGKAYVDMEISGEMQTTCSVKIDTNKLNEDNFIYVMYYPLDLDIEDMVNQVRKTYSQIFTVQD